MSWLTDIFTGSAGSLVKDVGDVVDKFVTTDAEKIQLNTELQKVINDHLEKMEDNMTERMKSEDVAVTDRWKSDMSSDNWLSKSARPLSLLSVLGFLFVIIIFDSIQSVQFDVKGSYIDLLQTLLVTIVVAYFGSRGLEKWQQIKKG